MATSRKRITEKDPAKNLAIQRLTVLQLAEGPGGTFLLLGRPAGDRRDVLGRPGDVLAFCALFYDAGETGGTPSSRADTGVKPTLFKRQQPE